MERVCVGAKEQAQRTVSQAPSRTWPRPGPSDPTYAYGHIRHAGFPRRVGALSLHMWAWLTSERVCTHPSADRPGSLHVPPGLAGILGVAAATCAPHRRPIPGTRLLPLRCASWASGQCPPGWKGQQHSLKLTLDRSLTFSGFETLVTQKCYFSEKDSQGTPM